MFAPTSPSCVEICFVDSPSSVESGNWLVLTLLSMLRQSFIIIYIYSTSQGIGICCSEPVSDRTHRYFVINKMPD